MRISWKNTLAACVLCVLLGMAISGFAATAQRTSKPATAVATTASLAKTAFQCKKKYHSAHGRAVCFSQLPGANCAHPLEAEKAHSTTRGEHKYFKLGYRGESDENGVTETYSYQVVGKNLAMCPHGAIFKVSRYADEPVCRKIVRHGHSVLDCTSEYATKNLQEPSDAHGGSFTYYLTNEPLKIAFLVVKARFIHPPWAAK
jgi:hypothetical protein